MSLETSVAVSKMYGKCKGKIFQDKMDTHRLII